MKIKKNIKKIRVFKNLLRLLSIIDNNPIPNIGKFRILADVVFCKLYYGILPKEYFFFSLYNKSRYARKQYVGTREREKIMRSINSDAKEVKMVLHSKKMTFDVYEDFFYRDVISVVLPQDKHILFDFIKQHNAAIIKPLASSKGNGIKILRKIDLSENVEELNSFEGNYVIEELIKQDAFFSSLHPESVNTIRYVTYYNDKKLTRLFALIRMGVGDSCVDNTCAGGISAAIDIKTGIIITEATSQSGGHYLFHPNTGVQIIGKMIPRWNELNEMVSKIVQVEPKLKIVGWDFALCDKGWCLIEGNTLPSFFGIQMALDRGVRSWLEILNKKPQVSSSI